MGVRLRTTGRMLTLAILTFLSTFMGPFEQAMATQQKDYNFKVFLEDDEIGKQRFVVSSEGERTQVEIEARFEVKFWVITVYTYEHNNLEVWEGECLREIRSKTNDNGESNFVRGTYENGRFQLTSHAGEQSVEGCLNTFAYWNPDLLQSDRLLNSQTGEIQPVEIRQVGQETITVRGTPTLTDHLRITSSKFTIDLWYTLDREWVALQSTTSNGKKLRYRLQ